MLFVASRLNITGTLCEETTPIEVLVQCMTSHGLEPCTEMLQEVKYRRKCIHKLSNIPPSAIKDERKAARYINNKTIFTSLDTVKRAMEHLISFENIPTSKTVSLGKSYGPITDSNPTSLDCTILYRLCKERGLKTKPSTTCEELYRMLFMTSEVPLKTVQDFLIDRIQTMSSVEIVNEFFHLIPPGLNFTREEILNSYASSRKDSLLLDPLKLRLPTTDQEAVLLAAGNFKIDISDSRFPMMEYAILFKNGPKDRSFPIDSNLQERVQRDSHALNLKQRFNPQLPEFVYQSDDLKKMATEEGWVDDGHAKEFVSNSAYDYLRSIYLCETFFAYGKGPMSGIQPLNPELVIELEPVAEQDPSNMVLFGSRSNTSALQAMSWLELSMTFESYRDFRNPLLPTAGLFSDHAVNKLIILAKKPCIDQTVADRRKRLLVTIENIRLENHSKMNYLNNIKSTIAESKVLKSELQGLLDQLYRMSLTMRSLKETDTLPDDGSGGSIDQETTQMNVTLAAIQLDNTLQRVDSWSRDTFLNLPLVIYYVRENKFSTSETTFEGHTIGGRLNIVHSGENTTAISSCLRLSSNWFLSTIYYYQSIFGFPIHFDISRLKHIG